MDLVPRALGELTPPPGTSPGEMAARLRRGNALLRETIRQVDRAITALEAAERAGVTAVGPEVEDRPDPAAE